MTKADIITKTLREMKLPKEEDLPAYSEEQDREEGIIADLKIMLPEGDFKTCDDFKHLNVECCEICHEFYPHCDMELIDLPDGGKAWICDNVISALSPQSPPIALKHNTQ